MIYTEASATTELVELVELRVQRLSSDCPMVGEELEEWQGAVVRLLAVIREDMMDSMARMDSMVRSTKGCSLVRWEGPVLVSLILPHEQWAELLTAALSRQDYINKDVALEWHSLEERYCLRVGVLRVYLPSNAFQEWADPDHSGVAYAS